MLASPSVVEVLFQRHAGPRSELNRVVDHLPVACRLKVDLSRGCGSQNSGRHLLHRTGHVWRELLERLREKGARAVGVEHRLDLGVWRLIFSLFFLVLHNRTVENRQITLVVFHELL